MPFAKDLDPYLDLGVAENEDERYILEDFYEQLDYESCIILANLQEIFISLAITIILFAAYKLLSLTFNKAANQSQLSKFQKITSKSSNFLS